MTRRSVPPATLALCLAFAGCGGTGSNTTTIKGYLETETIKHRPAGAEGREKRVAAAATRTAKTFVRASADADWATVCKLYSQSAIGRLQDRFSQGARIPCLAMFELGQIPKAGRIDIAGPADVDGDHASVGDLDMVREHRRWRIDEPQ